MPFSSSTMSPTSMAIAHFTKKQVINTPNNKQKEEEEVINQECKQLLLSLPKERGWRTPYIYKFQGFWCQPKQIQAILSFQNHFQASDTDVVLSTIPKSGTTWLKALLFALLHRKRFSVAEKNHPLLASNPHDLVAFFEYKVYAKAKPILDVVSEPRIFATHVPFASLQESIRSSNCKIVYVCRNPLDTFVSSWFFLEKVRPRNLPALPLREAFDMYCEGKVGFDPFWEHMLGYWKESLARPEKVLFLKYEDLKEDTEFQVKKVANFLGCPFTVEEEREGMVGEIVKLCSFEKLKDLEVNKNGRSIVDFENKHLFRKGEVGDWVNYLSPSMVKQLKQVMVEKLEGSGLHFKVAS